MIHARGKEEPLDVRGVVEHMSEKLTLTMTRANWIALNNHLQENGNFFGARVRLAVACVKALVMPERK